MKHNFLYYCLLIIALCSIQKSVNLFCHTPCRCSRSNMKDPLNPSRVILSEACFCSCSSSWPLSPWGRWDSVCWHSCLIARNLENVSLPLEIPFEDQWKFLQLKTCFAICHKLQVNYSNRKKMTPFSLIWRQTGYFKVENISKPREI